MPLTFDPQYFVTKFLKDEDTFSREIIGLIETKRIERVVNYFLQELSENYNYSDAFALGAICAYYSEPLHEFQNILLDPSKSEIIKRGIVTSLRVSAKYNFKAFEIYNYLKGLASKGNKEANMSLNFIID